MTLVCPNRQTSLVAFQRTPQSMGFRTDLSQSVNADRVPADAVRPGADIELLKGGGGGGGGEGWTNKLAQAHRGAFCQPRRIAGRADNGSRVQRGGAECAA